MFMDIIRNKTKSVEGLSQRFLKLIRKTSGAWAKWRMGTVAKSSRNISFILEEFRLVFDVRDFSHAKEPGQIKLVADAVTTESFGFGNEIVMIISTQTESLRGYCRGCPCHAAECRLATSKGATFECPLDNKSRIGC